MDDLVNQAIDLRLIGRHVAVTLHVCGNLFQRLASAISVDLVQLFAGLDDFARMDLDVSGLT